LERILEIEIESLRREMIQKAGELGFKNSATLEVSCKLDQLLNQLEKSRRSEMFYGINISPCKKEQLEKY